MSCPARNTGKLAECECDAPGASKARERAGKASGDPPGSKTAMTPAELHAKITQPLLPPKPREPAPGNWLTSTIEGAVAHGRCAECEGKEHHWKRVVDGFEEEADFYCRHCPATCLATEGVEVDGRPIPNESTTLPNAFGTMSQRVAQRLKQLSDRISEMTGYPISVSSETESYSDAIDRAAAGVVIHQICRGCRGSIRIKIPGTGAEIELLTATGLAARRSRLIHKCPPPQANYDLLSADELEALGQDLDREGTIMVDTAQVIEQMAAAKRTLERDAKKDSVVS